MKGPPPPLEGGAGGRGSARHATEPEAPMFADSYFDRYADAMQESAHRRANANAGDMVTKVEESPYGREA